MKNLKPSDFERSDYITNRKFVLDNTSDYLSVNQIQEQTGTFYKETALKTPSGFFQGPFFASVKQQFYTTEYKTETNQIIYDSITVVQIDPKVFDEKIKEGSLVIIDDSTSQTYVDDKFGNIYLRDSDTQIGNIFYEFGTIVITDVGAYQSVCSGDFSIEFRVQHTKTELNFQATIEPNEFNFSTNPTATINGQTQLVRPRYTYTIEDFSASYAEPITSQSIIPEFFGIDPAGDLDSPLVPHITTVGFYNEINQLLAVGKLASPTPIPRDFPITFRVRVDI